MLQHVADGILTGAIISLGAIGLSLTMRILRFANFSHAELMTFGALYGPRLHGSTGRFERLARRNHRPVLFRSGAASGHPPRGSGDGPSGDPDRFGDLRPYA
ncbi:MAG: hypothetical protein R3C97_02740 [Geminicoccaceae bacterium]